MPGPLKVVLSLRTYLATCQYDLRHLSIVSGGDTNVIGSDVSGQRVSAEVGGNLNVYRRWSPQQSAAKRRRMHPNTPEQCVSHETIYAAIYAHPRGGLNPAVHSSFFSRSGYDVVSLKCFMTSRTSAFPFRSRWSSAVRKTVTDRVVTTGL